MDLTKEQISELMCKHAEREHGLHDLFEIMLESMMVAERSEYLKVAGDGNKGNGYRLGHTYGQGRKLEFRIPRDRYGNFHPQILAVLKNQEEECDRFTGSVTGNQYLFGGKEYSSDTGLHDFEARYADTSFGRFTTMDPMAEKYYSVSPYAYCAGNPVNFVDPDGKLISTHTDAYGNVIAVYDDGDLGVYRHNLDNAA